MPAHARRSGHSLLGRVALIFAVAVIVTALALALSAYFITKAAGDRDALSKALAQTNFNLFLADSMLPAQPSDSDYKRLVDAFQIRGDFASLIEAGSQTYVSGFSVTSDLISPALAGKLGEGHIGYQYISAVGQPTLVVGGPVRSGAVDLYFFYPQGARLADLARLRNILLIGGVILAVLGGLAGYLLARGLVRPLRQASKAAVRMSQGDLDIRLPTGADEFGVLGTSFNHMAENLQTKMLDLEAGQARERRFVADVTHELRTPLSALAGEASFLKTKLEADPAACPADVTRLVTMVNTDITRLRQLVDDLLEISRLEAQAADTVIERVELGSFLRQLVRAHGWSTEVFITSPPSHGSEVAVTSPASREAPAEATSASQSAPGLVVEADRRRMERILVNLIENGLNHGATPIEIRTRPGADADGARLVDITVTDSGSGIPPEHLPHIFDRFYKADPSRASSRGSGLGLAIARENARLLGGDLTVATVPGAGARFLLTLPAGDL
jgi:signal transduction histidine kinase